MTEDNYIEIYKKLSNQEEIPTDEKEKIKKRFFELVDYKIK